MANAVTVRRADWRNSYPEAISWCMTDGDLTFGNSLVRQTVGGIGVRYATGTTRAMARSTKLPTERAKLP